MLACYQNLAANAVGHLQALLQQGKQADSRCSTCRIKQTCAPLVNGLASLLFTRCRIAEWEHLFPWRVQTQRIEGLAYRCSTLTSTWPLTKQ